MERIVVCVLFGNNAFLKILADRIIISADPYCFSHTVLNDTNCNDRIVFCYIYYDYAYKLSVMQRISKVTLGREVLLYLHFATLGSKRSKTARNHRYKNSVRNVAPNQRFLFNPIGNEMFSSCSSAKHIKGTKN